MQDTERTASDKGATAWARIASLTETAEMNGVNPHSYLKATLKAIAASHPASDIDALMPWAFTSRKLKSTWCRDTAYTRAAGSTIAYVVFMWGKNHD